MNAFVTFKRFSGKNNSIHIFFHLERLHPENRDKWHSHQHFRGRSKIRTHQLWLQYKFSNTLRKTIKQICLVTLFKVIKSINIFKMIQQHKPKNAKKKIKIANVVSLLINLLTTLTTEKELIMTKTIISFISILTPLQ